MRSRSTPHGGQYWTCFSKRLPGVDAPQNGTESVNGERRAKAVSRLAPTRKPPHRGRRVIHRVRIASGMRRWWNSSLNRFSWSECDE